MVVFWPAPAAREDAMLPSQQGAMPESGKCMCLTVLANLSSNVLGRDVQNATKMDGRADSPKACGSEGAVLLLDAVYKKGMWRQRNGTLLRSYDCISALEVLSR